MADRAAVSPPATRSIAVIISVAGVVFVSKLLGLGREMVVADRFGTSAEYDLYLIAVMMPALAYGIINFASYYLLVPQLSRYLESRPAGTGWATIWGLFNRSILLSAVVALLIIFTAPLVMQIWAGEYGTAEFARIILYARLVALMVIFGTSEAYLRALLNVRGIFTWPAGGYIVENTLFILSVLVFHSTLGVGAIVIGLLGGMIGQNLFLAARLLPSGGLAQYRPTVRIDKMDGMLTTIFLLLGVELINRSYFLFDRFVAADFGVGIISSLNYSQVLVQLPDAVVGFAIASVVFPRFARADLSKDLAGFANLYRNAIVGGMMLTIPLAAIFLVSATDLIQVVFHRGQFNAESVQMTATLLRPYTPTIIALFVISTSLRAAYGQGWVKPVFWIAGAALVVKAVGTLILPSLLGYQGITVATTLSQLLLATGLLYVCISSMRQQGSPSLVTPMLKLLIGGLVSAGGGYLTADFARSIWGDSSFMHASMRLSFTSVCILAIFAISCLILGFRHYFALLFKRKYVS